MALGGTQMTLGIKVRMSDGISRAEWSHQKHRRMVNAVKCSSCGEYVLSGADDKAVRKTGASCKRDKLVPWLHSSLFFSQNDQHIIVQSWKELALIESKENKRMPKTKSNQIFNFYFFRECLLVNVKEHTMTTGMGKGEFFSHRFSSIYKGTLRA